MHRIKTTYEIKTTSKPKPTKPRDPFATKPNLILNPERLSDNTLDTFLHRIRTEMLDIDNTNKTNKII